MTSPSRNAPCPCGSGKKYKKCCALGTRSTAAAGRGQFRNLSFASWCSARGRPCIVADLAALTLCPENLRHLLRLEGALHLAVAAAKTRNGSAPITPAALVTALEHAPDLQALHEVQDPPEGFFTEAVSFVGGSYIVYPGLSPEGGHAVRVLLRATFLRKNSFLPREVERSLLREIVALLALSNEVARRVGHERWQTGDVPSSDAITIPPSARRRTLAEAVRFSSADLASVLSAVGATPGELRAFCAVPSRWTSPVSPEAGPLLYSPVLPTAGGGCVLALPTGVITAIQARIFAVAEEHGLLAEAVRAFHEASCLQLVDSLTSLGFRSTPLRLPDWHDKPAFASDFLLSFDVARTCYVQLITDACPTKRDGAGAAGDEEGSRILDKRRSEVLDALQASSSSHREPVLLLIVLGGTGRPIHVGAHLPPPPHLLLSATQENLLVIAGLRDVDAVALWHFAAAYSRLKERARVQYWSFLDLFAFYRLSHESFCTDDELAPNLIVISSDYGRGLRHQTARQSDPHAAHSAGGGFADVVCRYHSEIPVYVDPSASRPTFLVETGASPLWIRPAATVPARAPVRLVSLYLVEAVAYWLWQVAATSPSVITQLAPAPLLLELELSNHEQGGGWENLVAVDRADESIVFEHLQVAESVVIVRVPTTLGPLLARADNAGERVLLLEVLRAFSACLPSEIRPSDEALAKARDLAAPPGLKKNIVITNPDRVPSIREVPDILSRKVQVSLVEAQLEGLADAVGDHIGRKCSAGDLPPAEYKEVLGAIDAIYLSRLKQRLALYDGVALLRRLVAANEALTAKIYLTRASAVSSAACFAGTVEHSKVLAKEIGEYDRVALALRFALEVAVAAPPSGQGEPDDVELDEIVAISAGLIGWAFLADEVRCRVWPHKLSVLPNGRVGTMKDPRRGMEAFANARALEGLEAEEHALVSEYDGSSEGAASQMQFASLSSAFRCEFGVSLEDFVCVGSALVGQGFAGQDVVRCEESAIVEAHVADATGVDGSVVRAVLELLTLSPRGSWEALPVGCDVSDLLPQRYGRRLSFLRRPILRLQMAGSEMLMWGSRHLHRAVAAFVGQIASAAVKREHLQSREMRAFWGSIVDRRGKDFEKEFAQFAVQSRVGRVLSNVGIGPRETLVADTDLGDLDTVVLDDARRIAYCFECKSLDAARNPVEVSGEMKRLIKGDPSSAKGISRVDAHMRRVHWMVANAEKVRLGLGLASGTWRLVPLVVTREVIPSAFLLESAIPIVSLSALQREKGRSWSASLDGMPHFEIP